MPIRIHTVHDPLLTTSAWRAGGGARSSRRVVGDELRALLRSRARRSRAEPAALHGRVGRHGGPRLSAARRDGLGATHRPQPAAVGDRGQPGARGPSPGRRHHVDAGTRPHGSSSGGLARVDGRHRARDRGRPRRTARHLPWLGPVRRFARRPARTDHRARWRGSVMTADEHQGATVEVRFVDADAGPGHDTTTLLVSVLTRAATLGTITGAQAVASMLAGLAELGRECRGNGGRQSHARCAGTGSRTGEPRAALLPVRARRACVALAADTDARGLRQRRRPAARP